jgi:DNA helicase-2/ATP-dependent DNA helicase PcrA
VAYNNRAAAEMAERAGPGLADSIRTLHSLGRAIVADGGGATELVSERDVRRMLEPMVKAPPRPNTDIIGPYIDALSDVRIGFRSPGHLEQERDDIPGFAELFRRYRARLEDANVQDFDEQIYGAIERLLADPGLRRRWQHRCRHMLVDEFQDLTPAYLVLIRLLASPGLDVFGVGDDDQVIYGYSGADPRFLIDYERLFPGAGLHALVVNHRCPTPVVTAARRLLEHNRVRIDKRIESSRDDDTGFAVERVPSETAATAVRDTISRWIEEGVEPSSIVVLCRVNSALLPVHAALVDGGVALRSPIGEPVLSRTVMSAALAWMRIGLDPAQISRSDLMAAVRRPSRGLTRLAGELFGRCCFTKLQHANHCLEAGNYPVFADIQDHRRVSP